MNIVKKKISELHPADYNPRRIDSAALAGLKKSIERFGLVEPIIYNQRTGNVVGGHQRLRALLEMGAVKPEDEIDVVVVDLAEIDEKTLNVALNNPAITGEYTSEVGDIIAEIAAHDSALIEQLCLNQIDLAAILLREKYDVIPGGNKEIDEEEMKNTKLECPKCGFKW
jgi:hypothetical protein